MIGIGSLVRYIGAPVKYLWEGKLVQVHERKGDVLSVWIYDTRGKYFLKEVSINDVEEVG